MENFSSVVFLQINVLLPLKKSGRQGLMEFNVFVTLELLFLMILGGVRGEAPAYFIPMSVF